jgi:hypothetical protein
MVRSNIRIDFDAGPGFRCAQSGLHSLIRAQPTFKPTHYPGSFLMERFPQLQKKAARA